MAARMFTLKLCRLGSDVDNALGNFNPALRNTHALILNRQYYAQEKYERQILNERRQAKQKEKRKRTASSAVPPKRANAGRELVEIGKFVNSL